MFKMKDKPLPAYLVFDSSHSVSRHALAISAGSLFKIYSQFFCLFVPQQLAIQQVCRRTNKQKISRKYQRTTRGLI